MVYTPNFSNEQAVAQMVIGATHMDTVTPANPTPPTNLSFIGFTPPTPTGRAAADDGTPANPLVFAAATTVTGGMQHEGAANDTTFTSGAYTFVCCGEPWSFTPNKNHPSSDDYTGTTTVMGGAGADDFGRDAVYADEEFEDEEEEATEAAREASAAKPHRGPGRPSTKGRHK